MLLGRFLPVVFDLLEYGPSLFFTSKNELHYYYLNFCCNLYRSSINGTDLHPCKQSLSQAFAVWTEALQQKRRWHPEHLGYEYFVLQPRILVYNSLGRHAGPVFACSDRSAFQSQLKQELLVQEQVRVVLLGQRGLAYLA